MALIQFFNIKLTTKLYVLNILPLKLVYDKVFIYQSCRATAELIRSFIKEEISFNEFVSSTSKAADIKFWYKF